MDRSYTATKDMNYSVFDLIAPDDYAPKVGNLVALLRVTNSSLTKLVNTLTIEKLDANIKNHNNSIGTLLMHMAAMEYWFQVITFEGRDLNDQEREFWKGALPGELINRSIKNQPIEHYLSHLNNVRNSTYKKLLNCTDTWLYQKHEGAFESWGNNYYIWFHLIEDHLCHCGQIKSIITNF